MKTYLISEEERQEVLKYIWTRPYGEVYKIMDTLLKLGESRNERVEELSKKKI